MGASRGHSLAVDRPDLGGLSHIHQAYMQAGRRSLIAIIDDTQPPVRFMYEFHVFCPTPHPFLYPFPNTPAHNPYTPLTLHPF